MRITDFRFVQVTGTWRHDGEINAAGFVNPLRAYPEHRPSIAPPQDRPACGDATPMHAIFMYIDTDAGVSGVWGPISRDVAQTISGRLGHLLVGENPHGIARIWDKMYLSLAGGGLGFGVCCAISAVDLALWDLKGKDLGAPVHKLLGGPTRASVRAYASMPGYVNEPEAAAERSKALVDEGYSGIKWFFRHHPAEGVAGFKRNLDLIRQIRAAVGDQVELMFDAWNGWDVPYTLRMIEAAAPYHPLWIEEPVLSYLLADYAAIRSGSRTCRISGGEHAYTRWGVKPWLEAGAVDVIQPDPRWAGGISEMQVICGLASTYGVTVVPHAAGHAATHLIASQPITRCPMQEHAVRDAVTVQFFIRHKNVPVCGEIPVPQSPGLGIDLDEDVIESKHTLTL